MGWFGKKQKVDISEKLGKEAGELTSSQIKTPFMLTEYLNGEVFTPPSGFFDDPYIKGYCMSYITTMADVGSARRGRGWSQPEKQTFMVAGLKALVGTSGVSKFILGAREIAQDANHQLGTLHANMQIKLMFAFQALDMSDPMFSDAIALSEASDMYNIVSAFQKVTMERYIEETYLL